MPASGLLVDMFLGGTFVNFTVFKRKSTTSDASAWRAAVVIGAIALAAPFVSSAVVTTAASVAPLQWEACPPPPPGIPDGGQQCARLSVPLDYRVSNGPMIEISISRVQSAQPGLRRGVLLLNPGGPGGQGLGLPRLFALLLPQSVRDRYDLIGFDPRFVGTSTPVSCGLRGVETQRAIPTLEENGGFDATVAFARRIADGCAAVSGDVLPFATTANTARDMDLIRQALGEQKISYLGYSYGTYLGAVYSTLFPSRTDRFVLDSLVDPKAVWRKQFLSLGLGGEIRFPDFANFLIANEATYHQGTTQAEVRERFFELVDAAERNPITVGTFVIDGPFFRLLTFAGLYNDGSFPGTAEIWQLVDSMRSKAGNTRNVSAALQPLLSDLMPRASAFPGVPEDNGAASALAIVCDDAIWSRSIAQYRTEYFQQSTAFPLFGPLFSNIFPCAFWPNQPVAPPVPISSTGPANILLVQNLRDPATPYPGARQMRAALGQRARFVTVDQGGHTAYILQSNTCANDTITAFLANGTLPGNEVSCPANAPAAAASVQASKQSAERSRAIEEFMRLTRPLH